MFIIVLITIPLVGILIICSIFAYKVDKSSLKQIKTVGLTTSPSIISNIFIILKSSFTWPKFTASIISIVIVTSIKYGYSGSLHIDWNDWALNGTLSFLTFFIRSISNTLLESFNPEYLPLNETLLERKAKIGLVKSIHNLQMDSNLNSGNTSSEPQTNSGNASSNTEEQLGTADNQDSILEVKIAIRALNKEEKDWTADEAYCAALYREIGEFNPVDLENNLNEHYKKLKENLKEDSKNYKPESVSLKRDRQDEYTSHKRSRNG